MKVTVNHKFNDLYNLFHSYVIVVNLDYFKVQLEEKWNIIFEEGLFDEFHEINQLELVQKGKNYADLEFGLYTIFINSQHLKNSKTLADYFLNLENQRTDEIRRNLITNLGFEKELTSSEKINFGEVFKEINQLSITSAQKWFLLSVIKNPKNEIRKFQQIIQQYEPIYKELKEKYWKEYTIFLEWITPKIEEESVEYLDKNLQFLNIREFDEVAINFSLFDLVSSHAVSDKTVDLYIGLMFKKYIDEKQSKQDIDKHLNIYKILSDPTRFEIIQLLIKKESYGQEIAEKLNISTATVSYHMDYLFAASLVLIKRKSRRVYYSVNKDQITESITFLQRELEL